MSTAIVSRSCVLISVCSYKKMMKDADELTVQKSVLNVHICYVICDKFLFLLGIFYDYCLQISANNVLNNLT